MVVSKCIYNGLGSGGCSWGGGGYSGVGGVVKFFGNCGILNFNAIIKSGKHESVLLNFLCLSLTFVVSDRGGGDGRGGDGDILDSVLPYGC